MVLELPLNLAKTSALEFELTRDRTILKSRYGVCGIEPKVTELRFEAAVVFARAV